MSRRSRPHSPPRQSRQPLPGGAVALDQMQADRQAQEVQLRMRVEGVAAAIFASVVDPLTPPEDFNAHCTLVAQKSIDAALVFARETWGIQGTRTQAVQAPQGVRPPQPIIEG